MRRLIFMLGVGALVLLTGSAAFAQINDDPATDGTTGLFVVPRASTLEEGAFSLGGYYSRVAREEGDSTISTIGLMGAYGLTDRLEVFMSFEPRVEITRRWTAERALFLMKGGMLTGTGINEHPFAFPNAADIIGGNDTEYDGVGNLNAGFKYRLLGNYWEYDGLSWQTWMQMPTSDAVDGIGIGDVGFGTRLIASLEAWESVGYNAYVGYQWWNTPHITDKLPFDPVIPKWYVSPVFQYGFGFQFPSRAQLQVIGELIGEVTTRDMNQAYTGGDDRAVLQYGLRLTTDSGWALNAAANYGTTIDVRDPDWQPNPEAVEDAIQRWGFMFGVSYSTSRRVPPRYMGTPLMDVPNLNSPPTLECRAERTTLRQGESTRLIATVNDPDGDPVTVTWSIPAGSLSSTTGNEVTWNSTGVPAGAGPIRARASDGYGGTADCELRVTVEVPPPPAEPVDLTFVCSEFRSGSSRIDNRCKAVLDDVALQMRQNPGATAVIVGHSDSTGAADRNEMMAQERADNARTYLVDTHGIDASRIETRQAGSSQPMADNSTAEGRAQNRRIEITVTIPGE